ncbi:MAG: hypothetical protein ACD_20C00109G0021 [uncultured bacterium]|nr:MAG: hypothetical protein ACD_20C00109G0021 [uncultured bacterium]HBH17969.1 hypothetical protein [Cyanobacteria bacterium UBA9579]
MSNILKTEKENLLNTLERSLYSELLDDVMDIGSYSDPHLSSEIVSLGLSKAQIIKEAILKVIENDKKSSNPVFIRAGEEAISKLAKLIANPDKKLKIGITGVTASGKTTILETSLKILNKFGIMQDVHYTRLNQDNYYKDTSDLVKKHGGKSEFINATGFNFDIPDALDLDDLVHDISGDEYFQRNYDKNTCEVCKSSMPKKLHKYIVVDGLFCLNPKMRDAFNIGIYIQTSPDKVKRRWYARARNRGNVGSAADFIFETAMKEANVHILPNVHYADFVINGDVPIEEIKAALYEFIEIIREI